MLLFLEKVLDETDQFITMLLITPSKTFLFQSMIHLWSRLVLGKTQYASVFCLVGTSHLLSRQVPRFKPAESSVEITALSKGHCPTKVTH
jgi:hypothetical protein